MKVLKSFPSKEIRSKYGEELQKLEQTLKLLEEASERE